MALFEILSKQDNPESATKVPAWMKRRQAEQADDEAHPVPEPVDEAVDETDNKTADVPAEPATEETATPEDGEYVGDDIVIEEPTDEGVEADADEDEYEQADMEQRPADANTDDEPAEDTGDDIVDEVDEDLDDATPTDDALEAASDDEYDEALDEEDDEALADGEESSDDEDETEYDADETDLMAELQPPPVEDTDDTQAAPQPPGLPAPAAPGPATPPATPWLALHGQGLRVTLSWIWAGVAAAALLLVLLMSFWLGRATAPDAEPTVAPPTPPAEPGPEGIAPLPPDERLQDVETAAQAVVESRSGQRLPDRQYLVIQTLMGDSDADQDEAQRIASFVANRGLPADVVRVGSGDRRKYAVWSLLGFRDRSSRSAQEHVEKVERIGKDYFDEYGTYDFRQVRGGQRRPFWVSGKAELKTPAR
jgi:hypothetical protein